MRHYTSEYKKQNSVQKSGVMTWSKCQKNATSGELCIKMLLKQFPGVRTRIVGHATSFTRELTDVFARVSAGILNDNGTHIEAIVDHNANIYQLSNPVVLKSSARRPWKNTVLSIATAAAAAAPVPSEKYKSASSVSANQAGLDDSDSDEFTTNDFERHIVPAQPHQLLSLHADRSYSMHPSLPIVASMTKEDHADLKDQVSKAPQLDEASEKLFLHELEQWKATHMPEVNPYDSDADSDEELRAMIDEALLHRDYKKSAAVYSDGTFHRVENI